MKALSMMVFALLLISMSCMAEGRIFKCEEYGQISYQDKPCESGEQTEMEISDQKSDTYDTRIKAIEEQEARTLQLIAEARALNNTESTQDWVRRHRPEATLGMTSLQVKAETRWGEPIRVNRIVTESGVREQWVYDRGYLYFRDQILVAIED